jgi:hypothetical protein
LWWRGQLVAFYSSVSSLPRTPLLELPCSSPFIDAGNECTDSDLEMSVPLARSSVAEQ